MSHELGKAPQACRLVLLDTRMFLGFIAGGASHTRMLSISIRASNFAEYMLTGLVNSALPMAVNQAIQALTEKLC